MRERVLYFMNAVSSLVITAPRSLSKGRRVTEVLIDQAHHIISHKASPISAVVLDCHGFCGPVP